jgi:hypothetical protein
MRALLLGLTATVALSFVGAAEAKKPEDVFGGKIKCSDKPYPLKAKSAGAYIAAVNKQSKSRFDEDKENKQWKIYYAAFFKRPINDLEVTLNIYNVTNGGQTLVETYEQYLNSSKDRVVTGFVTLRRSDDGAGGTYPDEEEAGGGKIKDKEEKPKK